MSNVYSANCATDGFLGRPSALRYIEPVEGLNFKVPGQSLFARSSTNRPRKDNDNHLDSIQ